MLKSKVHEKKTIEKKESMILFWTTNQRVKDENHRRKLLLANASGDGNKNFRTTTIVKRLSLSYLVQFFINDGNGTKEGSEEEDSPQRMILASFKERERSNIQRYIRRDSIYYDE